MPSSRSCQTGRCEDSAPSSTDCFSVGSALRRVHSVTGVTRPKSVSSRLSSRGSACTDGASAVSSRGNSAGLTIASSCVRNGTARSSTAGARCRPGMIAREKARSGGVARSTAASAGGETASVSATPRSVAPSCVERSANALTVRSKPVTSPASCRSCCASAVETFACAAMKSERSCGSVPRNACATIAEPLKAAADGRNARFRPVAPPPFRAVAYCCTTVFSFVRVSDWSEESTSSSWTGVAVCDSGSVPPSFSTGALGLPALRSTKKLPSRKIRGRTFSVASVWIGRPLRCIAIVTTTVLPFPRSTFVTLPTFTPAIRTGEFPCSSFAFASTAFTSKS